MKAFVYPMKDIDTLKRENPYLSSFATAIDAEFPVLNLGEKSTGFLNAFKYLFKCDLFFLNWVESLRVYNFPFIYTFLIIAPLFNKKVIWVHHNLQPHNGRSIVTRILLRELVSRSYKIIIHTKQSLNHIRQKYHRKCVYILHPYFTDLAYRKTDAVFDILIWGSVRKSKGILEFLDFFVKSSSQLKILIVGKFNDIEYYKKVTSCVNHNPNIIIENRYLCDEEFFDIHSKTKKVLFIYNGPSVLNSGALIKSLSTGREIIGPNRGAFVDYKNLGLIETFNTFDDIIELVETQPLENTTRLFNLKKSIETNSWELFGEKIKKAILTD